MKNNGMITKDDCKVLFEEIIDGNRYTDIEKATMKHIREGFKFAPGADDWLRSEISKWASSHKKRDPREPKKGKKTSKKAKRPKKKAKKDEDDEEDEEDEEEEANGGKDDSEKMDEAEDGEE